MFIYVLDYSVGRIAKIKEEIQENNCENDFDGDVALIEDILSKHGFDIDNCSYMTSTEELDLEEYG